MAIRVRAPPTRSCPGTSQTIHSSYGGSLPSNTDYLAGREGPYWWRCFAEDLRLEENGNHGAPQVSIQLIFLGHSSGMHSSSHGAYLGSSAKTSSGLVEARPGGENSQPGNDPSNTAREPAHQLKADYFRDDAARSRARPGEPRRWTRNLAPDSRPSPAPRQRRRAAVQATRIARQAGVQIRVAVDRTSAM
jgi:hypothetical protein